MNPATVRVWPRSFAWTAYLVATLLVLIPPANVMVQLPAAQWGNVSWRFGFLGLMAGAMLLPILGAFLWMVTARLLDQRRMSRIVGAGTAVVALLLTAMLVLFVFDAIQVRSQINPEMVTGFDAQVIRTVLGQILSIGTLVLLSATSFRGWKKTAERDAEARQHRDGIVVGSG